MVRAGYKETEVGEIPEDWSLKSVEDVATVTSGGTPNRKIKAYWDGHIPWITTALINGSEIIDAEEFITQSGLDNSSAKKVKRNTILMAMYGQGKTRGKVAILGLDATINQACAAIVINKNMESAFLLHYLNSQYRQIRELSNSGGQENLSSGIVKKIHFVLPPVEEQKAIAKALSDVDELIVSLEKLIAKKRDIKTGTMQQLLTGKKRLAGFGEGKGYKQTELGQIPEDWKIKNLGSIGEFKNGINKDAEAFGHGHPFVNLMDVFGVPSISLDSELGLIESNDIEKRVYDLIEGDVIFIRSSVKPTGVDLTSVIDANLLDTVYSGFPIRFRDSGKIDKGFKKYCFYEERFRKRVISASTVSANTNINQDSLKALEIILPKSKDEQKAIGNLLTDIELKAIQYRLEKNKAIKQGMMQELLTGKTRLIKPEGGQS